MIGWNRTATAVIWPMATCNLTVFMPDQFALAESAAQLVLKRTALRPKIGLVLGSGLGAFADSLTDATRIPYADIPGFPRSTAIGHAGQMVIGQVTSAWAFAP